MMEFIAGTFFCIILMEGIGMINTITNVSGNNIFIFHF